MRNPGPAVLFKMLEKLQVTMEQLSKLPADATARKAVFKKFKQENKIILINSSGRLYQTNLRFLQKAVSMAGLTMPTNKEFGGFLNITTTATNTNKKQKTTSLHQ